MIMSEEFRDYLHKHLDLVDKEDAIDQLECIIEWCEEYIKELDVVLRR